jgi:hypothetical protein
MVYADPQPIVYDLEYIWRVVGPSRACFIVGCLVGCIVGFIVGFVVGFIVGACGLGRQGGLHGVHRKTVRNDRPGRPARRAAPARVRRPRERGRALRSPSPSPAPSALRPPTVRPII